MNKELRMKKQDYKFKGITLISLVITIIVLIILASVGIYLSLGNNGIFERSKQAKEATNKQTATEIINLKITTAQMNKYVEEQRMPTLKELSLVLGEDNEIQYVTETSKVANTEYSVGENPSSIYTKLNNYPYEFEINSSLQLASINGIKIAQNNEKQRTYTVEKLGEATGTTPINIDTTLYDEIYIVVNYYHPNNKLTYPTHYVVKTFTITDNLERHCLLGGWNEGASVFVDISNKKVILGITRVSNTDTISNSKIAVWGIKY